MQDIDKWIDLISKGDSLFIQRLKARYNDLADKYCPELDEDGRKYLVECETVYMLANVYNGLSMFIDFFTDDDMAKSSLKDAVERYNALMDKHFEVIE